MNREKIDWKNTQKQQQNKTESQKPVGVQHRLDSEERHGNPYEDIS